MTCKMMEIVRGRGSFWRDATKANESGQETERAAGQGRHIAQKKQIGNLKRRRVDQVVVVIERDVDVCLSPQLAKQKQQAHLLL